MTSGRVAGRLFRCLSLTFAVLLSSPAWAQQRPLDTQDPQTIGFGQVLVEAGVTYQRQVFYPLSGLTGNQWNVPVLGIDVGIGPIADLQITGGPFDRLAITQRQPAPLASLVDSNGDTVHAVNDISIATKVRMVPEGATRPAIGLRFAVRLPNAKHESGLGQDTTDFSASVLTGKTVGSLRVVGNVGFTIMSEPLDAAKQNDVATYGVSVTRALPHHTELLGEIYGRLSTRNGVAPLGTESRGAVKAGGCQTRGPIRIDVGILFGLTSVDPTIGATAGLTYSFHAFSVAP